MFSNVNETNNNFRIIIRQRNLDIKLSFGCYEIEDITQYICNQIHEDNERINTIERHNKMYNDLIDFTMKTNIQGRTGIKNVTGI
jgi:hypothetical protein